MLRYTLGGDAVEAFSTNVDDPVDRLTVILPLHQAHSTRSAIVTAATRADSPTLTGLDALITQTPGQRIGVKTADCVPLLVYAPDIRAVAAIHSGWKGTLANIAATVIVRLRDELGADPTAMQAVIGPCIHQDAFEVGDELFDAFSAAGYGRFCKRMPRFRDDGAGSDGCISEVFSDGKGSLGSASCVGEEVFSEGEQRFGDTSGCMGEDVFDDDGVKWHIDLPGVCEAQLRGCGLRHIEERPECTYADHARFHSARRLGPLFDRQRILNCIALQPVAPPDFGD